MITHRNCRVEQVLVFQAEFRRRQEGKQTLVRHLVKRNTLVQDVRPQLGGVQAILPAQQRERRYRIRRGVGVKAKGSSTVLKFQRSEEHTSELQSRRDL